MRSETSDTKSHARYGNYNVEKIVPNWTKINKGTQKCAKKISDMYIECL